MECLACKQDVDGDSAFCDMCGIELSVCAQCRVPIAGKWCSKCGGQRVLASSLYAGAPPAKTASVGAPGVAAAGSDTASAAPASGGTRRVAGDPPVRAAVSTLRLRNLTLNLDLTLSESTLIGRTTGPLSGSFGRFDQISSKHCLLERDGASGWRVTDLGSTNGTFYNNQKIPPNRSQSLSNGSFLKIAEYEFFINID